ncbi:MAG: lipase family protein [Rhizobiales bacterium]|nr:lipase family protein [Hyphomicrobiales bacterium]
MLNVTDQILTKGSSSPRSKGTYQPNKAHDKFSLDHFASSSFSYKQALSLAEASKLAYENETTIKTTAISVWGFKSCEFLNAGSTQAFVAQTDQMILVAFRGTENNLEDWLGNMDIRTVSKPYGNVHKGFTTHYENIKEKLEAILANSNAGNKSLWLTGHSLGGAIATIAAAELKSEYSISAIHTFGQPRVGFEGLKSFVEENYADNFFRFVNQDDPIVLLPWKGARDWQEVGQLIHMSGTASITPSFQKSGSPSSMSPAEFQNLLRTITKFKQGLKAKRNSLIRPKLRDKPVDYKWPMDITKKYKKVQEIKEKSPIQMKGQYLNVDDHSLDNYIAALHKLSLVQVS